MMKQETFQGLYVEQIQDLYDVESQIIDSLPDMAAAASSEELKAAFEQHLAQTREQLSRLERVFAEAGAVPGTRQSEPMRALLAEARLLISGMHASPVLDAAMIAAAQRVEHYEICGYGTARMLAEMLDHPQSARLLEQTLEEEKETDAALTEIAEAVLKGEELDDVEEEQEETVS